MTATQEVLTNSIPPFPFFVENPVDLHPNGLQAKNDNHNSNLSSGHIDTGPLPDRCQFTFSDGRQCTMARSEIHPSLCPYHSERERQLFGEPAPGGAVVGAALDLPELHSACRDLTNPKGVSRALGQVMRLFAQRRISQKEAATFGYLAQLLLQSLSSTHAQPSADLADGAAHVASHREAQVNLALPPEAPAPVPSGDTGHVAPSPARTERRICLGTPHNHRSPVADHNPRKISTSEFVELKTSQNQHLHKNGGRGAQREAPQGAAEISPGRKCVDFENRGSEL